MNSAQVGTCRMLSHEFLKLSCSLQTHQPLLPVPCAENYNSPAATPRCAHRTCTLARCVQHPPFFLSPASRSAGLPPPDRRKEPSRAKLVRLASKAAVTPHSFSRRCFLSRQAANAQPTAWLSLSPCRRGGPVRKVTPGQDVCSQGIPAQSLCLSGLECLSADQMSKV